MKAGWQRLPFPDAVAEESGGNARTPQSELLPEGRFPVVDQGQSLIAGYVNDESRLCRAKLPVVVFGDHTRCFKFVDFPFCIGADGVKVLGPKVDADVKYLYHYLRQVQLTEGGYDRHFKYLKRIEISLPPLPEQRRIAEVLDRAEALRAKRRATLAQLDALTQALFLDMFGDYTTILGRWPTRKLGEVLDFLTSGSRGWAEHYAEQGDVFLRIQNVRRDELLLDDITYVKAPVTAEAKRTRVEPGDVLLSITADLGRTAVVPEGLAPAFINQHLAILRTKALVPRFLSAYLTSPVGQRQVSGRNRQAVKAGLNFDDIRSFVVPVPPTGLQQAFAHRVSAVEKLRTTNRASLAKLDTLFAALQYRAFRGEL